jgi:hypothetical protein
VNTVAWFHGGRSGAPAIVNVGRHPRRSAGLVGAVVLAAALAACERGSPFDRPFGGLGPTEVGTSDRVATAARGDLRSADFELASGVATLTIHSGDIGGSLYRIVAPAGGGLAPAAVVSGDHVVTQLVPSGTNGPSIVDVTLSSAVAWTIHLDGGATAATVDMRDGGLAGLDFGAGVSRIDVTLPKESGTLPVRMSGGSSEFTVHAPAGVPARVSLAGGGGSVTIDGETHTGIAGGTVFTPVGWAGALQRIDVDNTSGVSTFALDRY